MKSKAKMNVSVIRVINRSGMIDKQERNAFAISRQDEIPDHQFIAKATQ